MVRVNGHGKQRVVVSDLHRNLSFPYVMLLKCTLVRSCLIQSHFKGNQEVTDEIGGRLKLFRIKIIGIVQLE